MEPAMEPPVESTSAVPSVTSEQAATETEHTYKFDVKMTCGGCSGAVTRALERAKGQGAGISSYTVDLATQEVVVKGTIPYDDALEKIKKTGKEVRSGATVDVPTVE